MLRGIAFLLTSKIGGVEGYISYACKGCLIYLSETRKATSFEVASFIFGAGQKKSAFSSF